MKDVNGNEVIVVKEGGMSNLPRWAWVLISVVVVIIVCVLCRVEVRLGYSGLNVTQGLVK